MPRPQALRTLPIYFLAFDNFSCAIIGAGCSQLLLLVLRENGAVGVDIARHIVIPNGVAQMIMPILVRPPADQPPAAVHLMVLSLPWTLDHLPSSLSCLRLRLCVRA